MATHHPLVSVIVPNYNHALYLRQRLDSIFNQTYQDFEVIILDDCSTDNSKEIIEEYRNRPQISHIVYNGTNSGSPFKQWAKGFDLARGEYIWIAESDDWADKDFLAALTPIFVEQEDVVLAFCAINIVYENAPSQKWKQYISDRIINGKAFLRQKMSCCNAVYNASCAIFRKEILSKVTSKYQEFKGCGDWLFWMEISMYGNVYYSSKALDYFRQLGNNTTRKNVKTGNDLIEIWKIFQIAKEKRFVSLFRRIETPLQFYEKCKKTDSKASVLWKKELPFPRIEKIIYRTVLLLWQFREKILRVFCLSKNR